MSEPSAYYLLADEARFAHLGDRFRGSHESFGLFDLFVMVLVLGGIVVLIWLLTRVLTIVERRRYKSPLRLFLALCRAHEINWSDRWLIWRLARAHRLSHPAQVFVDPARFDGQGLSRGFTVKRHRLNAIRDKLFAEPDA